MDIQNLIHNKVFTVSEFNDFINGIVTPLKVTVEGEILDFRASQNRFAWFALKDEQQTLSCFSMMFRLRQPLEDGMKVRVSGYPKIHGKSGKFSFVVESLELSGEGSIQKAFLLLRAKLEKEGIFSETRKRPLPKFPQTIGLITSAQGAAYTDFMKHITARLGGIKITFTPVAVQGDRAVQEITAAFEYFNRLQPPPDVLVLTRGGGSLEDLQYFNSEEVVRAVFGSSAPVICAIGHEKDVALCELAADRRAATPTAAAQAAVPDRTELLAEIGQNRASSQHSIETTIQNRGHRLALLTGNLSGEIGKKIQSVNSALERFQLSAPQLSGRVKFLKGRGQGLKALLVSLAPRNILARGYSIVKKHGKIIKDASGIEIGDDIEITLAKGGLEARVKELI